MNQEFVFSSFFTDNSRLNVKIKLIILALSNSTSPLSSIISRIKLPASPIKILKLLILLHNIIVISPSLLPI